MHRIAPLSRLTPREIEAVDDLFQTICPMEDGYYARRLRSGLYDAIAIAEEDGVLVSAQLLNDFVEGGRRYVYLGPLVSRRQSYVGLIAHLIGALHESSGDQPITLMAEVQNPLVAVILPYTFGAACTPGVDAAALSPADRATISVFCRRLSHIDAIDWRTATTAGAKSMFRARPIYAPIVAHFKELGVDFAAGQSRIALIDLAANVAARAAQFAAAQATGGLLSDSPTAVFRALDWFEAQQSALNARSPQTIEESPRAYAHC